MKCSNLISYGPSAQIKIHKKKTKKTEVCGGSINVSLRSYNTERYGEEIEITYECIKCRREIPRKLTMNFPSDGDELRLFLIERVAEL